MVAFRSARDNQLIVCGDKNSFDEREKSLRAAIFRQVFSRSFAGCLDGRKVINCRRSLLMATGPYQMRTTEYEQLIARARCGDAAAIDCLLDECRRRMKEMATDELTECLGADWDPSDAIQESLLEAHRGLPDFRGQRPEALWAWLRTILEHNVADRLKFQRRQKRNGGLQSSLERTERNGRSLRESLVADQSSVTQRVVLRERLRQLDGMIGRLPEDQARVFRLRHTHGLSLDEIAERTGRTHASIAGLLIRATRRIDEFVRKEETD